MGVVTRLQAGFRFPAAGRNFYLLHWVPSVHSSGLKQPGCEAKHHLPLSGRDRKISKRNY